MKKIYLQIASLLSTAALLAAFGFLTFFLIDRPESLPEASVPLPDDEAENPTPETDGTAPPDYDEPTQDDTSDEDPAPDPQKRGSEYIRSKVDGLSIRSGPGTSYSVLGSLDKNDMVTYLGKSGNWYITEYKRTTAYVSAGTSYSEIYSVDHDVDENVETVIAEGYRLLGYPYVYGAVRLHDGKGNFLKNFDKTKYDCSSLTQYMYYEGAGVQLDVTTRTQVKQGTYVAKSDLKRGDLMFFTNSSRYNNTGTERIGHVAVYLGGNYILHTASDHAVIEPISTQRWNYYIESRRVL